MNDLRWDGLVAAKGGAAVPRRMFFFLAEARSSRAKREAAGAGRGRADGHFPQLGTVLGLKAQQSTRL